MATVRWVSVRTQWCDRIGAEARLMEQRVYPADRLPDLPAYRVNARRCSLWLECNLAGCSCRWAYTNPAYDPFDDA